MEHHSRRRGISLIRHQRSESVQPVGYPTQNHPTTHFNYPRYAVSQTVLRHTSTPKTSLSFRYQINPEGFVPTPLGLRHHHVEHSSCEKMCKQMLSVGADQRLPHPADLQQFKPRIEKYNNFEHCKEVIGNRLFGASPKSQKSIQNERQNRLEAEIKSGSQKNGEKVCPFNQIINMPLEVSQKLNIQVEKENDIPQVKVIGPIQKGAENITIMPRKQSVKVRKSRRSPSNLHDMEKRLLEIIKICDDNL